MAFFFENYNKINDAGIAIDGLRGREVHNTLLNVHIGCGKSSWRKFIDQKLDLMILIPIESIESYFCVFSLLVRIL